ncbi:MULTISPECIES: 4-hydroxy-2-oxovalerate aldolase [Thermus]|uniref:4-hydroxy-2-oxovalerate aldolase n=1 Tax=Thermus brockianus TaxID=56956 RepID=A0A1J0LRG7_THEBO|nr:4-hydroxy-2-oxovalerate aldolase [Thermus brockianus]APD08323.1 4-hydroxy-2-ketovalerate aldolase [Thermus brockianus]BDG16334.1 4-hydroxy-2-oxovalerate aldolase [Thermus brockianus]
MSWDLEGAKPPVVVDTTLRDGSHAHRHQYTVAEARAIARALDEAGVYGIEVAHGDGLGGSSLQYGFSRVDELELIRAVREEVRRAKVAALLLPGIGTRKELREAVEAGIQMVRIATQCTEADISEQHFGMAKEMGLIAVGFLMMSHMRPPEFLAEQARLMESYGADVVYIVDSAGAMLPQDAYARVKALKGALTRAQVGFHAHNNLGLAIGNTLAALAAGADWVDGTLRGYGAGAGNAATEVLAAVLDKAGLNPGLDVFKLLDAAEYVMGPILHFQPYPDRDSIAIGYAGVYSTFLLHAKRIGKEFGVDPLAILLELGRRQAVAGQEDWILRVALELKEKEAGALAD